MKANKVSNYTMRMLRENIRIPFTLIMVVLYVMESLFVMRRLKMNPINI